MFEFVVTIIALTSVSIFFAHIVEALLTQWHGVATHGMSVYGSGGALSGMIQLDGEGLAIVGLGLSIWEAQRKTRRRQKKPRCKIYNVVLAVTPPLNWSPLL